MPTRCHSTPPAQEPHLYPAREVSRVRLLSGAPYPRDDCSHQHPGLLHLWSLWLSTVFESGKLEPGPEAIVLWVGSTGRGHYWEGCHDKVGTYTGANICSKVRCNNLLTWVWIKNSILPLLLISSWFSTYEPKRQTRAIRHVLFFVFICGFKNVLLKCSCGPSAKSTLFLYGDAVTKWNFNKYF